MKFFTQFERPDFDDFNPGGGEVITESAGYVPIDKQIIDMINAGQRLGDFRKEMYDYGEGEEVDMDDVRLDPTRDGDYDEGDAIRDLRKAEAAIKDAKDLIDKVSKLDDGKDSGKAVDDKDVKKE